MWRWGNRSIRDVSTGWTLEHLIGSDRIGLDRIGSSIVLCKCHDMWCRDISSKLLHAFRIFHVILDIYIFIFSHHGNMLFDDMNIIYPIHCIVLFSCLLFVLLFCYVMFCYMSCFLYLCIFVCLFVSDVFVYVQWSLIPEQPSSDLISFCVHHQITNIHITVEQWNESITMTMAQVGSIYDVFCSWWNKHSWVVMWFFLFVCVCVCVCVCVYMCVCGDYHVPLWCMILFALWC